MLLKLCDGCCFALLAMCIDVIVIIYISLEILRYASTIATRIDK